MRKLDVSIYKAEQLETLAHQMMAEAKRCGAHQAEVNIAANKGFTVIAREGQLETVEYNQDKIAEIDVFFDKRSGSASISDLRPEAIRSAVEAACHIAKYTDEDPAAGLADKEMLGFDYPTLELAFPWHMTVEQAIDLACECEREALALDKRIMSAEEASVSTHESLTVYANTHGFIGSFPTSRHDISCVLVAKKGDEMQRDFSYSSVADPAQLKSVTDIAREAVERTVRRLGARQLPTMKVPVIYAAEEARSFFGHFISAISGSNLYRKSSYLIDQLDKRVFPDFIHMQEFPHLARALGSSPFDGDGLKTRNNVFVENGILQQYALSTYAGRKLGMSSTANAGGTHNLTIRHGHKTLPELIKTMGRGLLITEMMGNGVNITTGDYSRGVGGFWVENGEIQYPVHEITVAGTLKEMYMRVREIGCDVDTRGNIRTGSVLLEEMTIAGL